MGPDGSAEETVQDKENIYTYPHDRLRWWLLRTVDIPDRADFICVTYVESFTGDATVLPI